jgi:hypothetical protein
MFSRFSKEERNLIIGLVILLLFGAVVRSYRHRVEIKNTPVEKLPSVEDSASNVVEDPERK